MTPNRLLTVLALAPLLLAGCGRRAAGPAADAPTNAPPARSAIADVLTQRPAIEAGLRAKAQIRAVEAAEKERYDAVLGDE